MTFESCVLSVLSDANTEDAMLFGGQYPDDPMQSIKDSTYLIARRIFCLYEEKNMDALDLQDGQRVDYIVNHLIPHPDNLAKTVGEKTPVNFKDKDHVVTHVWFSIRGTIRQAYNDHVKSGGSGTDMEVYINVSTQNIEIARVVPAWTAKQRTD